jgi:sugar transferase (PEP-CTERM/EpsH1 system associated)
VKIAFLATRPPFPPNIGGRIRTYQLLRHLSARHEVTLITSTESPNEVEALISLKSHLPRLACRSVAVSPRTTLLRHAWLIARASVDPLPHTWAVYRNACFATLVATTLAAESYDVLHCDHVHIANVLFGLRTPPRVLNEHNVEYRLVERIAALDRRLGRRTLLRWQATRTERAERRACAAFDHCLAVSDEDQRLIQALAPGVPVSVVPNGVDIDWFSPVPHPVDRNEIVFTGAMDWLPNIDGVRFFARDVLPRIREARPETSFSVVGRNPDPTLVAELQAQGAHVTGTVDDVRPYLARASLVVVPLRMGGGTRLKILEAWAMAKPVLSTTLGAEGLRAIDGEHLALADGPEALAARSIALLSGSENSTRLGQAGRRIAEACYAWPRITRVLEEVYGATIADTERRRLALRGAAEQA